MATRPWFRLDVAYWIDAKVRKARAGAIWPWVLSTIKRGDGFAPDEDLDPELCATDLDLEPGYVADRLANLKRCGLLFYAEGEINVGGRGGPNIKTVRGWRTPNWEEYQPDGRLVDRSVRPANLSEPLRTPTVGVVSAGASPNLSELLRTDPATGRDGTGRDGTPPTPPARKGGDGDGDGLHSGSEPQAPMLRPHVAPDDATDADPIERRAQSVLTLWHTLTGHPANQGVILAADRWVAQWPLVRVRYGVRLMAERVLADVDRPVARSFKPQFAEAIMARATTDEIGGASRPDTGRAAMVNGADRIHVPATPVKLTPEQEAKAAAAFARMAEAFATPEAAS